MRFALQLALAALLLALLWRIPIVHGFLVGVLIIAGLLVIVGICQDIFGRKAATSAARQKKPITYSTTAYDVLEAFFADTKNYNGRYIEEIEAVIGPYQDQVDWDRGQWDYRWHTKQGIFEVGTQSGYVKEFRKLPIENLGKWLCT